MKHLTLRCYQGLARRTARRAEPGDRVVVSALGLAGEAGELCGELQHAIEQERAVSVPHLCEELGDCLWRIADICSAVGLDLEQVALANVDKLRRRHPLGFSAASSAGRADERSQGECHSQGECYSPQQAVG